MIKNPEMAINSAVSNIVDFIKQNVKNNLHEGLNQGLFQVENEDELRKISDLVSTSIDQGFVRAHGELKSTLSQIC